jgi:hypothetical protein
VTEPKKPSNIHRETPKGRRSVIDLTNLRTDACLEIGQYLKMYYYRNDKGCPVRVEYEL